MAKKRGQGEGSIFEEAPGKWRAVVSLGFKNGRRVRKSFTAPTRREVQTKLTKALRDHDMGLPVTPNKQTVGQFLHSWLNDVAKPNVRPKTFASYSWIIRLHLAPGLGRVPLAKLSPPQVQRFMNDRLESLAPRTVQHIHATLRVALGQAEKWGLIPRNVASLVEAPRVPRVEIQPLAPELARHFLEAIRGDRLEALYSVAMAIGLRQGEALGLQWSSIDFETGKLAVTHSLQRINGKLQLVETKRDRSRRTITLPQVCISALLAHRARQEQERIWACDRWKETGFVFTTTIGTPLDGSTVTHRFQKALKAAGLPHLRFHDLRHTCATLLLAQGVHPRLVMEILGHSQIAVTMNTYSHVIPAMQKEVANQMDAILAPPVQVAPSVAPSAESGKVN